MWALSNKTAYAAERNWIRDKHGVHHWVVCVKASFDLAEDGSTRLSDGQVPPLLAAEYFGEPGKSSVRYEADLVGMKTTTDVTLLGSAYAPHGRAAESVPVSLRVHDRQKVLIVHGTRVYYEAAFGIEPYRASPFVALPIRYEDTYGGADTSHSDPAEHAFDARNPIGVGFARRPKTLVGSLAPRIEYPQADAARPVPAGFGPIASYWSPRLERAGTYDAHWSDHKRPLLPDDYDERFTQCAPADQQADRYLHGGERVELVHLTPAGVLRFELPKIYLTFSTRFGKHRAEHRSRLASVVIEPDELKLRMIWQTTLKVSPRNVDYLDETVIREKPYLT
jgi:hypothetical protein